MGLTLASTVTIESVGIHSGQNVTINLVPQSTGGIVFFHQKSKTEIPLTLEYVHAIYLGTNLNKGDVWIRTIEHLSSVLWALEITDLRIELAGDEVPIADGSGVVYWNQIKEVGVVRTDTVRPVIVLEEPFVQFYDNDIFLMAFPADELSVNYTINFPNVPVKAQNFVFNGRPSFKNDILNCRTFGNKEDIDKLHSAGKALGASLDNCLAYDSNGFVNDPRHENESVRHKILDLLGDFYASGYDVQAKIIAYKTSHAINNQFLKDLFVKLKL